MNKAITEGIAFAPPPFSDGLDNWSKGDGSAGAPTYANDTSSAFVPSDPDFGGALELTARSAKQILRARHETPIFAGCYLQMTVRLRLVGGQYPSVRITALALDGADQLLTPIAEFTAPAQQIDGYGKVIEVTAIIGTGKKQGVDIVLPTGAKSARLGIEISGRPGARLVVDDFSVQDVSNFFLEDLLGRVDVRDYGARGDGVTDDFDAFVAADRAAAGRTLYVPRGTYVIGQTLQLISNVDFDGSLDMPDDAYLALLRSFTLTSYTRAFGSEEKGFLRAFQALMNASDHSTLDLEGRRITLTRPAYLAAAVANRDTFVQRRVLRNGEIVASDAVDWPVYTAQATASYDPANPRVLTGVTGLSALREGSLVTGNGVGREVYITRINEAAGEVELSLPLHCGQLRQSFTFTRFSYLLDFSGFELLRFFQLENVELRCGGRASGMILPKSGRLFRISECSFTYPKDRAITSPGSACAGMLIDRCFFETNEVDLSTTDRQSIAINGNSNDIKIRNNWASQFRHFMVLAGAQNIVTGNHFFQDDAQPGSPRLGGVILTRLDCQTTLSDNYVDNAAIEWTNEHNPFVNYNTGASFSGLTIANNVFLSGNAANWFSFIVVKPYGAGHHIQGMTVTGNGFLSYGTTLDRVERVDASIAPLNLAATGQLRFSGNYYQGVTVQSQNPLPIDHSETTHAATWAIDAVQQLPFGGPITGVSGVVLHEGLSDQSGAMVFSVPQVATRQGDDQDLLYLHWPIPSAGRVSLRAHLGHY